MDDPQNTPVPDGMESFGTNQTNSPDGSFDEEFWNNFFSSSGLNSECSTHYKTLFKDQDMKPDMVDDMDHSLLTAMGVSKAGHRIKILRAREKGQDMSPRKTNSKYFVFPTPSLSQLHLQCLTCLLGKQRREKSPRRSVSKPPDHESHTHNRARHSELLEPKDFNDKPCMSEPVAKVHKKASNEMTKSRASTKSYRHSGEQIMTTSGSTAHPHSVLTIPATSPVTEKHHVHFHDSPRGITESETKRQSGKISDDLSDLSVSSSASTESLSTSSSAAPTDSVCADAQTGENKCITYYVRSLTSPYHLPADQHMTIAEFTQRVTQVFLN